MDASPSIHWLLDRLRSVDATAPRLIWYGPDAERIELSGRVLDNWIAKTSNLLVEELDAVPGTRVGLQLPGHWKTLVWTAACWQVGAVPVDLQGSASESVDILVSDSDADPANPSAQLLVLVALGALDLKWAGTLPAGAVDYAAEVRGYGDEFLDGVPADPNQVVLEHTGVSVSVPALFASSSAAHWTPAGVLMVPAAAPLHTILSAAAHSWSTAGTLIMTHSGVDITAKLLSGERVTDRVEA